MRFRLLFSFVPLLFQILFFALEYLKTVSYISKINTNRVLMFITDFLFCFFSNRNEHLHRCSQCKVAKYCGKSCQKEAWLDHKQECKCLKSIKPNFPPDSVRLAGRIVFKLLRQSVCISERLYSFSDLQSNTEQLSEEMKDGLRHLAHTLQLYLKAEIQDASHLPAAIDFFQIFTKVRFLIQHVLSVDMGGESTDVPHATSGGGAAVLLEGCLAGGHDSQPQQSSRDHALPHAPLSQGPVSS
uniref:[histone H3]-lysine(4) N-trimethyltransferase n=1 Tax=Anas platyrhynchos platyrhynchos TaxID=8840 RepID=A0A493TQ72_ANAPP